MQRNDKCFCGSGLKYKKCHLRINSDSKLANMYRYYHLYDFACKERNICNDCINNCSRCCNDFFLVTEFEFLMILEELIYKNIDIFVYVQKAKEVLKEIQKKYPKLIDRLEEHMPTMFDEGLETKYFDDTFDLEGLPSCIFLDNEKRCVIYATRPVICRGYGTTESCRYIKNSVVEIEERQQLYMESLILKHSKNQQVIVKRPYPLFYWFACFLDEKYYRTTMERVKNIRDMKVDEFYLFEKSLMQ